MEQGGPLYPLDTVYPLEAGLEGDEEGSEGDEEAHEGDEEGYEGDDCPEEVDVSASPSLKVGNTVRSAAGR